MIISFKNLNGGGGGGGYVLPTATPTRLGGVKIGDGVNVDSAGTISVEENYAIINDINQEFETGKMYALVNENVEFKDAEDSVALYLKNNGAIASFDIDTSKDNYEFNPFFSFGNKAYIDIYVNSNNGLSVNYYDNGGNIVINNEPLNIDEVNTFELPSHTFVGRLSESVDFSGCSLDVCIMKGENEKPIGGWIYLRPNGTIIDSNDTTYPSIQSFVSGHTSLEKMYMQLFEWHYSTNLTGEYCTTVLAEPTLFDVFIYDGKNLNPVITEQDLPTKDYSVIKPNEGFDAKAGQAYAVLTNGIAVRSTISQSGFLNNEGCVVTYGYFGEQFHIFQGYNCNNSEYVQFDIDKGDNFTFKVTYRHNGVNTVVVDKYLNYGEKNTIELPEQVFYGYNGVNLDFVNCSADVYPDIDGNGKVIVVFRPNGAETELNNDNIEYTAFDTENSILNSFRITNINTWFNYSSGISLTNDVETVHYDGDVLDKVYLSDFNGSYTAFADYKGGIPKTFAVDDDNYEFDLNLREGDVLTKADIHTYPRCQIEDNNMNTLNVGEHTIGNEEKMYVWSEMADDKLVLKYGDYYNHRLYIYGGQDQHFRFENKAWNGFEETEIESGDIYQGETATTVFFEGSVFFDLNFEGESLEITTTTNQDVPFTVFYNQEHKEMFLNDGTFMRKDSGERAALDSWYNGSYGNNNRHIVFLYYGELPQNEILFKVHHNQWSNDTYWSWDGEKLCSWNDENMSERNTANDMYFNTNGLASYFYMYNFTEGILSIASRELDDVWELYGNWYEYNEGQYEPIDWQNNVKNIKSFALPLAYGKINGVAFLGGGDINLNGVPNGGMVGQVLKKANDGFAWSDLTKDLQVVDSLPPFADEGSVAIVNGGIAYASSNAFLAANTTNPDDKNNFNDDTDISHIGNGNYIYFDCNGELTNSTAKTFLFRIAMRTNENGDWSTSNIAYINVFREYNDVPQEHFYSWEMPPFVYKDSQGNDFEYSDSGTVDSSTTANTTSYLPLWKWSDGTYGYKFTFEYDNVADTLKVWLNHSNIDQIQGENYGDVDYRCKNHTKEFFEYTTDPNMSEVYTFKGGAWYKLGELTSSNI